MDLTSQPWFGWTLAIIVALPVLTLVLAEVHLRLVRRHHPLARPINRLRIWLLPTAAFFILLTRAGDLSRDNNGVRVVATMVGLITVSVALGVLNAVLFDNAAEGTWQKRLPSIFVDLTRLVLIVTGAAIVASFVWGLDVGGLFAALGVGSIVIGLALQNAVGSVVSGLLLLFEQPFNLGDTLEAAGATGRVVEMNWRSTHLDTGTGIQIIPNAVIAGSSFTNFSRPTPEHDQIVASAFSTNDVPHEVLAMLIDVAEDLPYLRLGERPGATYLGGGKYSTRLPLVTAADASPAASQYLTWLWYAARRRGLSLDGVAPADVPAEDIAEAIGSVLGTLGLSDDELASIAGHSTLVTYAGGESVVRVGEVPSHLRYVVSGVVIEQLAMRDGSMVEVAAHDQGEVVGVEAVLREPSPSLCSARSIVTMLQVPVPLVDRVLATKPDVARRLNDLVEVRNNQRLAAAGSR